MLTALLLMASPAVWAATSDQDIVLGTPLTFADAAQSPTVTFTLTALASGAGQSSARLDRTTAVRTPYYKWRCVIALTGTNVAGEAIEVYLATGDGTNSDGQLATTTASLASAKRNNLVPLGVLVVDQTTTNTTMSGSGLIFAPDRYLWLALWNATSLPFQSSTSAHNCSLTPVLFQMQ